jgi:hypothetical protein
MPILRRTPRHRWAIAAPRLTVRAQVAWYWRALAVVGVLAIMLVVAVSMYDAGRRFAGFDARTLEAEVATLRQRVADLEDEAQRLRAGASSGESRVQIERTSAAQLGRQLKAAETEIARLREDLAFFDNLSVRDTGDDKLSVSRFKVERDALPGEYRYRVLVTQGGRKERDFKGRLQFVVNMQLRGDDVVVVIPDEKHDDGASYRLNFRRFHRAEGSFKIDPAASVQSIQVRIFEQGGDQPRITHNYTLS